MEETKNTKALQFLLVLYILSLGFTDLLNLPIVEKKIQLPEFVFIPLFLTWLWNIRKSLFQHLKPGALEISILLYLISLTESSIQFQFLGRPLLEVIGVFYLILVFIVFKTSLAIIPKPSRFVRNAFLFSGVIAAMLGIAGWMLSQSGLDTILSRPADIHYPYFGHLARATGLMNSPNMLLNFLGICLLVHISQWNPDEKFQKHIVAGMIIIAIGVVLTFSKSILILIIAILFLKPQLKFYNLKISKFCVAAISMLLFLVWVIGTHIVIRNHTTVNLTQSPEQTYTLATPFANAGGFDFYITNYIAIKTAAIELGRRAPLLGVCPGQFNASIKWLKIEGKYPLYFNNFDPHSSYFGAFAETGVIGLLALLLLWFQILRISQTKQSESNNLHMGIAACMLFIALEAISLDVMNFRHLWVLLGILAFLFAKQSHDIKPIGKNQQT